MGKIGQMLILIPLFAVTAFLQDLFPQDTVHHTEDPGGLFSSDSLLKLTLVMDYDTLLSDRGDDPSYHDGTLMYLDKNGSSAEIQVEARVRGNFRKKPEICNFPPLKIKFSDEDIPGTLFEGLPDIKIVSHCQDQFPEFEQYVLQEYLIYKLYNLFTDLSFRVRLARICYLDKEGDRDGEYHYAFFIENPESVAARNGGELLELKSVPEHLVDQNQLILLAVFNYMIINTDYSVPIMHNIELVSRDFFAPPLPVPYDFDWSGMLNIPYNYNYNESKEYPKREYKGPCIKRRDLNQVLDFMKSKRSEVFQLYVRFPYLAPELKTKAMYDLNVFYLILENRSLVRKEFRKNCHNYSF